MTTAGDVRMEAETGAKSFEDGGRGHEPRNGGGHEEAEKDWILLSEPPEGTTLTLATP